MPIAVRELRHVKVVESCGHCERRWAAILCGTMVEIVTPEPSDTASCGRAHALEVAAENATLGCGSPITYDRTLGIHVKVY
jgi:hypothetical protein